MLMIRIPIFLGEPEVNDINLEVDKWSYHPQTIKQNWENLKIRSEGKQKTWFARLPMPMRKLSGLRSRCRNDLEWTNSRRLSWKRSRDFHDKWTIKLFTKQIALPSDLQAWEQSSTTTSYYKRWTCPQGSPPISPSREHCSLLQPHTI